MTTEKKTSKKDAAAVSTGAESGKFTRKGAVTVPSLSLKTVAVGQSLYVKFTGAFKHEEQVNRKTGEVKKNDDGTPQILHVAMVEDLAHDGALRTLVLPAIPFGEFCRLVGGVERLPELNGRAFELVKGSSTGLGKANLWEVYEIEA